MSRLYQLTPSDSAHLLSSGSRRRSVLTAEGKFLVLSLLALMIVLAVSLVGRIAHAQVLAGSASTTAFSVSPLVAFMFASVVAPIVAALIAHFSGALPALRQYIEAHTNIAGHNEINAVKDRAIELLFTVAQSVLAYAGPDLQKALADGLVTSQAKADFEKFKGDVLATWRAHATPQGLADALKQVVCGGDDQAAVQLLSTHLIAALPQLVPSLNPTLRQWIGNVTPLVTSQVSK